MRRACALAACLVIAGFGLTACGGGNGDSAAKSPGPCPANSGCDDPAEAGRGPVVVTWIHGMDDDLVDGMPTWSRLWVGSSP